MPFLTDFLWSQFFVRPTYPSKDRTGETIIVTGSNIGLGLEAARHFARLNAKVILAVRNIPAGEEAKESIEASTGKKGTVEVWKLDLGSYDSVKAFAERASKLPRLDAVVENAGIATKEHRYVEDNESTITVNVISTFLLAYLILPKLRQTASKFNKHTNLTIVSSEVHEWVSLPEHKTPDLYAALNDPKTADMDNRYPISKLLEILYLRELTSRLADKSTTINILNPGFCHSGLARELDSWGMTLMKLFLARSTEMGSRTLVAGADGGEETWGQYMCDSKVHAVSPFVRSKEGGEAQKKVWEQTNKKLEKIQPGIVASVGTRL
ncbi:MAG: hypothetical protein Q9160_000909 [Pyrenula sp. 1 TL-2023]